MTEDNNDTDYSEDEDIYDTGISDEDYGFVIGPDGELKSVFIPAEHTGEVPEIVQQILEMFGYSHIDEIPGEPTLH